MASDYGGYDLDARDCPPDEYNCPICHLIMKDPQIVSCCGYKYCLGCISRLNASSKPCPMCLEAGFNLMPEKYLHRKIQDIKVSCPQAKEGCKWVGEIREVEKHLEVNCDHIEMPCPLGCGKTCKRSLILEHQEEDCPNRTPELKLSGLARKMEMRLAVIEAGMEDNISSQEILALKEELKKVNETNQKLQKKVDDLEAKLESSLTLQDDKLRQALNIVRDELIRRCISFPLHVSTTITWTSPSFYTHSFGYLLQLSAKIVSTPLLSISLFSSFDDQSVHLALDVLPQNEDEARLDWPVYVSIDFLVLCNADGLSVPHTKVYTLTKYKGARDDPNEDQPASIIIGRCKYTYNCRLLILNISYGPEPPKEND